MSSYSERNELIAIVRRAFDEWPPDDKHRVFKARDLYAWYVFRDSGLWVVVEGPPVKWGESPARIERMLSPALLRARFPELMVRAEVERAADDAIRLAEEYACLAELAEIEPELLPIAEQLARVRPHNPRPGRYVT